VIALDVLRAITREPESLERVLAEVRLAHDARVESFIDGIGANIAESLARRVAERLALALQASLLIRFSRPAVADAFCASRLAGVWGRTFGTLPATADLDAVLAS
jgi:putative acyl-CoA dehydrogenase